jgi:hypothetical protein
VKRQRQPRVTPPNEVPLDEGAREGTDEWREVDGIRFCHWDRWLLRLALDEPGGLHSISSKFRTRASEKKGADEIAEAMLAQVEDLGSRLTQIGAEPATVLDEAERASKWLQRKAFRRVWQARTIRRTVAMTLTPRRVLEQRALLGNWAAFPVSPAPYHAELKSTVGEGYFYGYGGAAIVVLSFEMVAARLLSQSINDQQRLAVHRAMLSAAIGAMAQVDDSLAELGEHVREHERAYLALLGEHCEIPGLLCDLLELAVWEDYGLFCEIEEFLRTLPNVHAVTAKQDLDEIMSELGRAELDYQLGKARALHDVLADAAGSQ